MPSPVTATVIAAASTDEQGYLGSTRLIGYVVRETAAGAATLAIHDGTSASGPKRFNISLASGGLEKEFGIFHPLPFDTGIWIERLTGTTEVILYHIKAGSV